MMSAPCRSAGFTLVELMLVLLIVGLASSAVMLTLPDGADELRREADQFAMRLQRAQEEAILGIRAVRVSADSRGYEFSSQRFDGWQALDDGPFKKVSWRQGVRPVFEPGREQTTFRFEPAGDATVESLVLVRDDKRLRVRVDSAASIIIDAGPD